MTPIPPVTSKDYLHPTNLIKMIFKEQTPAPRKLAAVQIVFAVANCFGLNWSEKKEYANGSVAAIAIPRTTLMITSIPNESTAPVIILVKLQRIQAALIAFFLLTLLAIYPQYMPAKLKLKQNPAPDISP